MRPVKELADVANKLEVLEDLVEELQGIIADIKNLITKSSSWIDEKVDTTYQDIRQMLVSKTCDYVKQLFLMAYEKNGKLSEPVNIEEEMKAVSGIQTIKAAISDLKGSLDYRRLQENLKEITASTKSNSEMIEILQKRNKSLEKENIKEIAANVKLHSHMIESLQEKNKALEKLSEKILKQNQTNETICDEHYKEIMEELSVASSFMSTLKDENIKLSMDLKEHNKKVDDVSDRVNKGRENVSEFAKDQPLFDELKKQNKILTDAWIKDQHHLDELKEEIQRLTEQCAKDQHLLDELKIQNKKLTDESTKDQHLLDELKKQNKKLTEESTKDQHLLDELKQQNKKLTDESAIEQHLLDQIKKQNEKLIDESSKDQHHIDELKKEIQKIMEQCAKDQHLLDELKKQNKKLTDELTKNQHLLDDLKKQNKNLTVESTKNQQLLDDLKKQNKNLTAESTKNQQLLDDLKKQNKNLTAESIKDQQLLDKLKKQNKKLTVESTKNQDLLDELKKRNKKLTDESTKGQPGLNDLKKEIQKLTNHSVELMQQLDNAKENIEKLQEENANYQASLETTECENKELTEKLDYFPKDVVERVKRSLVDVRKKGINFLLLGCKGFGKSALGNSILQRKCFQVNKSDIAVHTAVQCEMGEFNSRGIGVFELPDCHYQFDGKQSVDSFKVTKDKIKEQCAHGFSVILLVLRFGWIKTHEIISLIEDFKSTFGQNSLKAYGIFVMTDGDRWKQKAKEKSFQDWIEQEVHLKEIVAECNGRALVFENRTYFKEKQTEQLGNLMKMVDKLMLYHTFQVNFPTKTLHF